MPTQTIHAADGFALSVTHYPTNGGAKAAVIIAPAMGVPQSFYAPFALWLSGCGYNVYSFDYRGMGASLTGSLRDLDADLLVWAELDCSAILDAVTPLASGLPVLWLGHSVGGQLIPFIDQPNRLTGALLLAAGSGYWRHNAPSLKRRVPWLWWCLVPLLTPLFGYFPGERLNAVGNLPAGVIWQWRRWCLDPAYAVGVLGEPGASAFDKITVPLQALYFSDDEFLSRRSIDTLTNQYRSAPSAVTELEPSDVGESRCGHLAAFRETYRDSIWQPHILRLLDILLENHKPNSL